MQQRLAQALWVCVGFFVFALSVQAQNIERRVENTERRVALVIGNAAYKSQPLQNPTNDSTAMAALLRSLGFEVIERSNLNREGFARTVREYGERLKGASVGLFYFAGHGIQIRGKNFLIPVDADIAHEDEVPYRSFDIGEVLDKMDSARTATNLVILDACRNNPFGTAFRPSLRGLAQMEAPAGTLIAFATAPGSLAQDGEGSNGLYTAALLKHMTTRDLAVEQMFKRVRVDVMSGSKNAQVPWDSSSLVRDFVFASAVSASTPERVVATSTAAPTPISILPQGAVAKALETVSPEQRYRYSLQGNTLIAKDIASNMTVRSYDLALNGFANQLIAAPNGRHILIGTTQGAQIELDLFTGSTQLK